MVRLTGQSDDSVRKTLGSEQRAVKDNSMNAASRLFFLPTAYCSLLFSARGCTLCFSSEIFFSCEAIETVGRDVE
jgi:hypothetical protein